MSLIVTGSIGLDTVEAPTGAVREVLGGSAVYFSAAAGFFGPVRMVAAVGDDFPPRLLRTFDHFGVDVAGLERRAGSRTFRWHGRYHADMNRRDTVAVQLNVLAERLPPVPAAYRDSRYVFLANTHPAGQDELLAAFPRRRMVVADTMDLWINNERPALLRLIGQLDGLVLNDTEAQSLTGQSDLVRAARAVLRLGPRFAVIKKGEHGALLALGGTRASRGRGQAGLELAALPAFPATRVVDPTGAGDSFAGAMMGCLARRGNRALTPAALKQAIAYGTVVASFTIEAFSLDRLRRLKRADIDRRYRAYAGMLRLG